MPEINPYESPQADSHRESPRPDLKPPAFWLAVIAQALCLGAALACMSSAGYASRIRPVQAIREITMLLLAFAVIMGVGIIIASLYYRLQGWVAGETLLLSFVVLLMFA